MFPMIYEKKHTPNTMIIREKNYSPSVRADISPYPTVDMVVNAQYSDAMYTVLSGSSA